MNITRVMRLEKNKNTKFTACTMTLSDYQPSHFKSALIRTQYIHNLYSGHFYTQHSFIYIIITKEKRP